MSQIAISGLAHCPMCACELPEESEAPLFGRIALGGADLVSDTSVLLRNAAGAVYSLHGQDDPASFSALGLTTVFSALGGALTWHSGLHESVRMRQIGDVRGEMLADLRCYRGGLQAVTGALFLPIRGLSMAGTVTASKTYSVAAGVLGQVGSALFGAVGLMQMGSTLCELQEEIVLWQELNQVYYGAPEGGQAQACLQFLKSKQTPAEKSALSRALGGISLAALEAAQPEQAQEIITQIYADSHRAVLYSLGMLVFGGIGVAGSLLSLASAPTLAALAGGLNAFTAAVWLGFDLCQFATAARKPEGQYDHQLMAAITGGCAIAAGLAFCLGQGLVVQGMTAGLAFSWLLINLATAYKHAV